MKKINCCVVGSLFVSLLSCSKSKPDPIESVKNSVLSVDKSVTVGNAFERYKYFKNVSWNFGEDDQRRQIVTFKGVYNLDKFAGASYSTIVGVPDQLTPERVAAVEQANPKLEFSFIAQFKLAVDGNSFELGYHGIHVAASSESDQPDENDQSFNAIYQNEPSPVIGTSLLTLSTPTN